MTYCDFFLNVCLEAKDWLNLWIAIFALLVSFFSLIVTIRYASKSFRPIVTAAVKTHSGGNEAIIYNLVIKNSGSIPARQVRIQVEENQLAQAFGADSCDEHYRRIWLACFSSSNEVSLLQNGDSVSCSFGTTKGGNQGFWRYGASIAVTIRYQSWFGRQYCEEQILKIRDSDSFTGYLWR